MGCFMGHENISESRSNFHGNFMAFLLCTEQSGGQSAQLIRHRERGLGGRGIKMTYSKKQSGSSYSNSAVTCTRVSVAER